MRLILKLFALPLLLLVMLLWLISKGITHISSYVIGLLLLVLAGCGIYCVVNAQWMSLAILAAIALAVITVTFLIVLLEVTIEGISQKLGNFIWT